MLFIIGINQRQRSSYTDITAASTRNGLGRGIAAKWNRRIIRVIALIFASDCRDFDIGISGACGQAGIIANAGIGVLARCQNADTNTNGVIGKHRQTRTTSAVLHIIRCRHGNVIGGRHAHPISHRCGCIMVGPRYRDRSGDIYRARFFALTALTASIGGAIIRIELCALATREITIQRFHRGRGFIATRLAIIAKQISLGHAKLVGIFIEHRTRRNRVSQNDIGAVRVRPQV